MGEPMGRSPLEDRLEAITREFVMQIVSAIRSASFADVAGLQVGGGGSAGSASGPARRGPAPLARESRPATRVSASPGGVARDNGRARQTADRRAELGERVVKALEDSGESMGVRALSQELGVAPDLLAAPLKELRAAGRIAKHGEKRATTYSVP